MPPAHRSVLRDGIVAGVIGAAVVALWFLVLDIARGKPFLTPALLGAAVFYGITTPVGLTITAGPLIGYTLLHVLAFVAFGIVAASLLIASEHEPPAFDPLHRLKLAPEARHGVLVQRRLLLGQVAVDAHLHLLREVLDDARVGLHSTQDERSHHSPQMPRSPFIAVALNGQGEAPAKLLARP